MSSLYRGHANLCIVPLLVITSTLVINNKGATYFRILPALTTNQWKAASRKKILELTGTEEDKSSELEYEEQKQVPKEEAASG